MALFQVYFWYNNQAFLVNFDFSRQIGDFLHVFLMLNDIFLLDFVLTLCIIFFKLILSVEVINREVQLGLIERVVCYLRVVKILSLQVFYTQHLTIVAKIFLNVPSMIKIYLQLTEELLPCSIGLNILESLKVIYGKFLLILSFE